MLMVFFLLQACQSNEDTSDGTVALTQKKASQAAGYNVQLGLAYLKQGDISRSKRKLLLAMAQNPRSSDVNAAMAYFMEKTGEADKAKTYYQKAMAAEPGRGRQLNNYGAFLCRQTQYAQAEVYFLKAVQDVQYENTAGAYENAGLCAMAIPDDNKAMKFFNKALEQDPSRKQSLYELTKLEMKHNELAPALLTLQKYPEAVYHSQELLALAVKLAHQLGNSALEADYNRLLKPSGVN